MVFKFPFKVRSKVRTLPSWDWSLAARVLA